MSDKCPVCNTDIQEPELRFVNDKKFQSFSCKRCGDFTLDTNVLRPDDLRDKILKKDPIKIAKLSHWIRTRHESLAKQPPDSQGWREAIILEPQLVKSIIDNPRPSPNDQADSFVRWMGDNSKTFGEYVDVHQLAIQAIVGSATFDEFVLVFGHVRDKGLIEHKTGGGDIYIKARLSFAGWERYEALKRATAESRKASTPVPTESRKAFMAMQYGDAELERIYLKVFKPAVKETGFNLRTLREKPKAGSLDDRLRAEIETSRFLIADLTHENAGAYWEAGYAEALKKPVIYTCEKKKWEKDKTHFDTNHYLTIPWDSKNPEEAAQKLKNTIRATLPAEAKLTDD